MGLAEVVTQNNATYKDSDVKRLYDKHDRFTPKYAVACPSSYNEHRQETV